MNRLRSLAASKNMDSPLFNLPDHVVDMILKSCDYPEIATLRKTCSPFWEYLGDPHWKCSVSSVHVQQREYSATLKFRVEKSTEEISIEYRAVPHGCEIRFENRLGQKVQKILEGGNLFYDAFFNDFGLLLEHVSDSVLDELYLDFNTFDFHLGTYVQNRIFLEFSDRLNGVLTRTPPMKTRTFKMRVGTANRACEFLTLIDSEHLKSIWLTPMSREHLRPDAIMGVYQTLATDQISNLEQWRKAEEVKFENLDVLDTVQNFFHFKKVDIIATFITPREVEEWIRKIMAAGDLSNHYVISKEAFDMFIPKLRYGEPFEDTYYFFSAQTDHILRLIYENRLVEMNLISKSDVPGEAVTVDFDNLEPLEN